MRFVVSYFLNGFILKDTHIFKDGVPHELKESPVVVGLLLSSASAILRKGFPCRESLLANFDCFCSLCGDFTLSGRTSLSRFPVSAFAFAVMALGQWSMYLPSPLVGHTIIPFDLSPIELPAAIELLDCGDEPMLLDHFLVGMAGVGGVLDDEAFLAGVLGQYPAVEFNFCQLIEGLPLSLLLLLLHPVKVFLPLEDDTAVPSIFLSEYLVVSIFAHGLLEAQLLQ